MSEPVTRTTCPICGNDKDAASGERVACASCLAGGALDVALHLELQTDQTGRTGEFREAAVSDEGSSAIQCSPRSQQGALRLFSSGYLPRLHSTGGSNGHSWTIPSETQEQTEYTLHYDPESSHTVSCTCPGWTYRNYCKHVRFLEFALGLVTSSQAGAGNENQPRTRKSDGRGRSTGSRPVTTAA